MYKINFSEYLSMKTKLLSPSEKSLQYALMTEDLFGTYRLPKVNIQPKPSQKRSVRNQGIKQSIIISSNYSHNAGSKS